VPFAVGHSRGWANVAKLSGAPTAVLPGGLPLPAPLMGPMGFGWKEPLPLPPPNVAMPPATKQGSSTDALHKTNTNDEPEPFLFGKLITTGLIKYNGDINPFYSTRIFTIHHRVLVYIIV